LVINFSVIPLLALSFSIWLAGCASLPQSSVSVADASKLRHGNEKLQTSISETSKNSNDEDDVLSADERESDEALRERLEDGFCRDDVVGRYLVNRYLLLHAKSTRGMSVKSARRMERKQQTEAIAYARAVVAGPTFSYFGAIPVVMRPEVEQWISYFRNGGRSVFLKWLVRGEKLRHVVEPYLQEQGLPPDLIYLAMVESGFSNSAFSSAKAVGAWQFMSGTARLYGLKIDPWVDERRDPVKATIAAARLLATLYQEFGDWYLAMAAYNAGSGRIRGAINKVGSRSFWDLAASSHIKPETKQYVPKFLAAVAIANHLEDFGFDLAEEVDTKFPTDKVRIHKSVRLDDIAMELQVPLSDVLAWNPELVRGVIPYQYAKTGYDLRLPKELHERFFDIENQLEAQKPFAIHRVQKGDTLAKIARLHRVSIADIRNANPRLAPNRLGVGGELTIPLFPGVKTASH
jgi:membrane-bound lytic murein transglycosylase D